MRGHFSVTQTKVYSFSSLEVSGYIANVLISSSQVQTDLTEEKKFFFPFFSLSHSFVSKKYLQA